eukprot:CAMPEP_0198138582 /NCGR_PEP_ID=MMETSP1443-20131203/1965_1 /TAXON_ID=186043 /ORGANISM="Entomoneis sp., Strain CCMP2396" /LENGTH=479 /DNA_ID=CAMNT_0043800409 /DNA_START=179 /DNA_END=1615 /DNA_ORIENTATION=-
MSTLATIIRTKATLATRCNNHLRTKMLPHRDFADECGGNNANGRLVVAARRREFSSSSSDTTDSSLSTNNIAWPLTSSNLGLLPSFCPPQVMASVSQLPEVLAAIQEQTFTKLKQNQQMQQQNHQHNHEESFHRSIDIFERMQQGGKEHLALLALLSEYHQRQGEFQKALETMESLAAYTSSGNSSPYNNNNFRLQQDVALAQAKVLWLQGKSEESAAICLEMLKNAEMKHLPMHHAAARNGQALSRLVLTETLDDALTLRDPSRMVIKFLEQQQEEQSPLLLPIAYLNYGSAEIIYAQLVSRINGVDAPLDGAMRAWAKGLACLRKLGKRNLNNESSLQLFNTLKARLNVNLAWGALEIANPSEQDNTQKASEFARKALKALEKNIDQTAPKPEGYGHVLSLVATCYHKSGQAVTAEGLLQTAVDETRSSSIGPSQIILQREILLTLSRLLRDWENREEQGQKFKVQADSLNAGLPKQ